MIVAAYWHEAYMDLEYLKLYKVRVSEQYGPMMTTKSTMVMATVCMYAAFNAQGVVLFSIAPLSAEARETEADEGAVNESLCQAQWPSRPSYNSVVGGQRRGARVCKGE